MPEVSESRALSIESCLNCRPDLQPLIEQLQVSEVPEGRISDYLRSDTPTIEQQSISICLPRTHAIIAINILSQSLTDAINHG